MSLYIYSSLSLVSPSPSPTTPTPSRHLHVKKKQKKKTSPFYRKTDAKNTSLHPLFFSLLSLASSRLPLVNLTLSPHTHNTSLPPPPALCCCVGKHEGNDMQVRCGTGSLSLSLSFFSPLFLCFPQPFPPLLSPIPRTPTKPCGQIPCIPLARALQMQKKTQKNTNNLYKTKSKIPTY